jgi:hypothetical protein
MATISSLTIEKGRSRLQMAIRMAVWLFLGLALLLIVGYMVVTSPGFIKRFILPRVSAAIHADVTVAEISVHPFSKITVRGLKVQVKGQEPLLTAPEIRASYSLGSILRGNLRVAEVALVSPTVTLVENPDGTSNLGDLMQSGAKPTGEPAPPRAAKPSKPWRLDVRKVAVSNATFRKIKKYGGNRQDSLEAANISLALANLKNGQAGTLMLGAFIQMENNPPTGQTGHLQAALNGNFSFTLSADLKPAPLTGQARLDILRADGGFGDLDRFSAVLDCSVSPTEIKQLALHFQRAGATLGQLAVSGPLDVQKLEGRLKVELRGLDQRLLNLVAAREGMDFGGTTINSSNDIELTKAGDTISVAGRFDANNVQLTRAGQTTPTLKLNASYALTVDRTAQTLLIRGLSVTGAQNGNPLLAARLTQPMNLAWGANPGGAGDSALDLTVTGLNLADWRPFLGSAASEGNLGLTLKLSSSQAGRRLDFNLNSQVQNFSTPLGDHGMVPATVNLRVRGQAANFNQFNLDEYRLQILQQNQSLAVATGSGAYDATNRSLDLQVALQASFAVLGQVLARPDLNFATGTAELKARVTRKPDAQTMTGKLEIANLTGQAGKSRFRFFGGTMDLDIGKTPEQIQFNRISGALSQSGKAGGTFQISGNYDPSRASAKLTASLSGLNQNGLRPFLEPLLADKVIVSIAVNGNASVDYDSRDNSTLKASMLVTNLVVSDLRQQFPPTPLEAGLQLEAGVKKQVADVRRFQITLTPTKRGKNEIQLQGRVDYSQSNAVRGDLKFSADSLDLTGYYDLFARGPKGGGKPAATPTPGEPPAKFLPLKNFALAADIGRLYLHEVEVTGWQTTANVDGGHVVVKPCKFALNGAPVNATVDLNLGVPGYRYDVAVSADRVPFAPLVNTFLVNYKGQMGGNLTAQIQIRGAGVTGASLQRNLTGQFAGGVTNLNLAVDNARSPTLRTVINVVATLPQLLSNPASALVSWMDLATGRGGGLMDTLRQSPIQVINAQGKAGGGRIDLQSATVQSTAFKADARGAIALAQVLTNSTLNIPVVVSVSQPIAKQLNLASGHTSTNAAYVSLPQFLTMTGTLGVPKADINKLAVGGMTVKSLGGGILNIATNGASQLGGILNQLINTVKPK